MKKQMTILLLALAAPAMAAEIDSKPNSDRYIADDLEIATLPNGEVVTRLVSRSRLTERQFWTNSVYPQGSIVVFQGKGGLTQIPGVAQGGPIGEQRILQNDRAPNDVPYFQQLVTDMYAGQKGDKGLSQIVEQGK